MDNKLFNRYCKLSLNLWLQLNKAIHTARDKKSGIGHFFIERETGLEPATLSLGS